MKVELSESKGLNLKGIFKDYLDRAYPEGLDPESLQFFEVRRAFFSGMLRQHALLTALAEMPNGSGASAILLLRETIIEELKPKNNKPGESKPPLIITDLS